MGNCKQVKVSSQVEVGRKRYTNGDRQNKSNKNNEGDGAKCLLRCETKEIN